MPIAILSPPSPHVGRHPGRSGWLRTGLIILQSWGALIGGAVLAGPVLCTTTLEAPPLTAGSSAQQSDSLVEVTRCGVVETVPEMIERRYYGWSAPFPRAVSLTHQITDLLGIAMGGGDGRKVMGLGYLDQTLIWDGSALQNTAGALMEEQYVPMPIRTSDLPSVYGASIGDTPELEPEPLTPQPPMSWPEPVRGMW